MKRISNKKIQYSKIITSLTFMLFLGSVIKCFSVDISGLYDLSLYATIVTSTGAICLTSVVWYLKNSQAEKVARIRTETYKVISDEQYKYNRRMLELKHGYNYAEEEIFDIENNSHLDELKQDALHSMNSSIDCAMEEATSSIEAQVL